MRDSWNLWGSPSSNEYVAPVPSVIGGSQSERSVKGDVAACEEFDHMGNLIRAQFRIVTKEDRSVALAPICPNAKHPDRATSVFLLGVSW